MNRVAMGPVSNEIDAKQLIRRRYIYSYRKRWPFEVAIADPGDKPMIKVTYKAEEKQFSVEEIGSMILSEMRRIFEDYYQTSVEDMVVFVPANFNDSQLPAIKDAGRNSGLHFLHIIQEPTAFAIAYGFHIKKAVGATIDEKKNVLVIKQDYDTFDVSVFTIDREGIFEMKAIGHDTHIGEDDFTNRMLNYVVEEFKRKHKKDISGHPRILWRLRNACERANISILSSRIRQITIDIDDLYEGADFHTIVTLPTFEGLTMDFIIKGNELVDKCLTDAEMNMRSVHEVVLVGRSTSSAIAKAHLALKDVLNLCGKPICKMSSPDKEVAAYRGVVRAAILRGEFKDKVYKLVEVDVTALSLGIEEHGQAMLVIIPRNTPIPTKREKVYTTCFNNYGSLLIRVYEGERTRTRDNIFLGELGFATNPSACTDFPIFIICFEVDANGILNVSAMHTSSGVKNIIRLVTAKTRLSKRVLESMIEKAKRSRAKDEDFKSKANLKQDIINYTLTMRETVKKLLSEIDDALRWFYTHDLAEVKEFEDMLEALKCICNPMLSELYEDTAVDDP